jgi:hypothetical protein
MGNAFICEYFTYCSRRRGPDSSLSTVNLKGNSANNQHYCFTLREMEEFCVLLTAHLEYNRAKKNQLVAQLILSIFRQPLHVSGVSRPIIWRYNRMYTTIGTYYSF